MLMVMLKPLHAAAPLLLAEEIFPPLQDILRQAVAQSPTMVIKHLDILIAEGDRLQSRAGMLPHAGGGYQFQLSRDYRADALGALDTKHELYNFAVTQPVFHWGVLRNTALMGKIQEEMSKENYEDAYSHLAQQIRSSYLGLVVLKVQLENAKFNLEISDRALASVKAQLAKQAASPGRLYEAEMDNARERLALNSQAERYLDARQDFAALTGTPVLEDAEIPDKIPALTVDPTVVPHLLTEFLAVAEPKTRRAEVLRQTIRANELAYMNQRKRLYPNLDFVIGVSQDQQRYSALGSEYLLRSKYIGLQVNWNLFDGFATKGAIASARARKLQAEEAYQQYVKQSTQDAERSARMVNLARQQMQISERQLNSSQGGLNLVKQGLQRGQNSEDDLAHAQASYNNALVTAVNDRYNYLNQVADFIAKTDSDPMVEANLHQP